MSMMLNFPKKGWIIKGKILHPPNAFPTDSGWLNHYETFFVGTISKLLNIIDKNNRYGRKKMSREIVPKLIEKLNKKYNQN